MENKRFKEAKDILAIGAFVAATLLCWQKAKADTSDLEYMGQKGEAAVASLVKTLKDNAVDCVQEKTATSILEYGQNLPDFLGTPLEIGADFLVDQSLSVEGLPQWVKDGYAQYCAGARMDLNRYREQLRTSGWLNAEGKLDLARCSEIIETILPSGSRMYPVGRAWDVEADKEDPVLRSVSYRADRSSGRLFALRDDNKHTVALVRVDALGAHLTGESPARTIGKQITRMVILPKEQTYCAYVGMYDDRGVITSYTQTPEISYGAQKDNTKLDEQEASPVKESVPEAIFDEKEETEADAPVPQAKLRTRFLQACRPAIC